MNVFYRWGREKYFDDLIDLWYKPELAEDKQQEVCVYQLSMTKQVEYYESNSWNNFIQRGFEVCEWKKYCVINFNLLSFFFL